MVDMIIARECEGDNHKHKPGLESSPSAEASAAFVEKAGNDNVVSYIPEAEEKYYGAVGSECTFTKTEEG